MLNQTFYNLYEWFDKMIDRIPIFCWNYEWYVKESENERKQIL